MLTLYGEYDREQIHDIFSPNTDFTPQAGTWGLQGIVRIPNRPGDFVFFVTLGQQQGAHVFDEGITTDGVLTWQSQPKQWLADYQIQQFIRHDELKNSIYLFFRTQRRGEYTYLGRLKYLSHDNQRQFPVFFQWQLMEWEIPRDVLIRMQLKLGTSDRGIKDVQRDQLEQTAPPISDSRKGIPTTSFQSDKVADYSLREAKNRELGLLGEYLVVAYEKKLLTNGARPDLASRVQHISALEGDGAGYDIASFTIAGAVKHIEVKTTTGTKETPFFMTANEVVFADTHLSNYCLYRLYNYDKETNSAKFYIVDHAIADTFLLIPTQYKVSLKVSD